MLNTSSLPLFLTSPPIPLAMIKNSSSSSSSLHALVSGLGLKVSTK